MKLFPLLLILTLAPFWALAQTSEDCLTQEQADELFNNYSVSSFQQNSEGPAAVITSLENLCDSQSVVFRLAKAINYLNGMNAYQDPNSTSIVTQEGAGHYFSKRIKSIQIEAKNGEDCPSGVVAYVYRIEKDVMHICSGGLSNFSSPLLMSSVLVHEARHTDGFRHVACKHGMYRLPDQMMTGSGSCDDSFEEQGSYGVTTGFMREIAKLSTDPVEQQQARSSYVVDLIQRFNKLPLDIKPGIVVKTKSGNVSFFDGKESTTLLNLENPNSVMTMRGDIPAFFDQRGFVKSYNFAIDLKNTKGDFAYDFASNYSQLERESLKDVYYGSLHDYSCLLFTDKLHCGDNNANDPDVEMPLTGFVPIQFVMSERSLVLENQVLYITAEDGFLYSLPTSWKEFKALAQTGKLPHSSKAYKILSLVNLDDTIQEYGVNFMGRLLSYSQKTKKWTMVPEYRNQKVQKLNSPFFWSKRLEEL